MRLTSRQVSQLSNYGISVPDGEVDSAVSVLVKRLSTEITDITDAYSIGELLDLYEAIFGFYNGTKAIYNSAAKPKAKKPKTSRSRNCKKRRINLAADVSYATPLLEHLVQFECVTVCEIKTGLAVKCSANGYKYNVMNFLELRTVNGELYGNLYFNMIRSEAQASKLGVDSNSWYRGYCLITKVSMWDVIEFLTPDNIGYLLGLSLVTNKRRTAKANRLIGKFKN